MTTLSEPAMPARGPTEPEARLGELAGDRPCIRCGFNLTGQTIVREPHYGLIVVRCPECATVASVQEYPLLGRWAARWGLLLSGVWLAAILAAWAASAAILYGFAVSLVWQVTMPLAGRITEAHIAAINEEIAAGAPVGTAAQWGSLQYILDQGGGPWATVRVSWWESQDLLSFVAASGGWGEVLDLGPLRHAIWAAIPIAGMGVFWPVALLHVRRRALPLVAASIVVLAGLIIVLTNVGDASTRVLGMAPAMDLARQSAGVAVTAALMALFLVALAGAMLIGRPVARLLVRAMLPPRMRGSLAALWLADGLPPPRTRGG